MAVTAQSIAALAEWLDEALVSPEPVPDIVDKAPDLSVADAYQLQFDVMARRVARGDRIIGYKAALTSQAMQRETGIPEPLVGTLLHSRLMDPSAVSLSDYGFLRATLEPEIAVLMGRELRGPGLSAIDAWDAVAGFFPAIELGDYRYVDGVRTMQNSIACNTFNGGTIIGGPLHAKHGLDLRTEGLSLWHNGVPAGSGTGVEVLGDPMESVAFIANKLGEFGRGLDQGMLLMTGSITRSIELNAGDQVALGFTRLGSLSVRIVE